MAKKKFLVTPIQGGIKVDEYEDKVYECFTFTHEEARELVDAITKALDSGIVYLTTDEIAKAKSGDVLVFRSKYDDDKVFIFDRFDKRELGVYCHIQICYDREVAELPFVGSVHPAESAEIYVASKEQREMLFKKMQQAGYEWDDVKKELKRKQKLL